MSQAFDRRAIPAEAVEGWWTAADGWKIRRIDWLIPHGAHRGSILFLPGRGDFYEKYLETLDHWHRSGWRVTASDWRGQAGSGRLGKDPETGHIADFATWVADLTEFWLDWCTRVPGPHILAAHSMGGHLALRAVAEGKIRPDALILSAPMLGFHPGWAPVPMLQIAAKIMCGIGDRRRPAWKYSEKPGQLPEARIALLTHDQDRYDDELWWRTARPELAMGPGSWGWVERAYASNQVLNQPGVLEDVATPITFIATSADKLVEIGAIDRAVRRLPRAELLRMGEEARHEVLRETDLIRDRVLDHIDRFLDQAAPRID